mmetsp:Transcript_47912/g.114172  ORF Transcript_47912/g.114172 Transcript_47912/m.114172 type:complete len:221 (-) Transcript_47912:510-1172(-)
MSIRFRDARICQRTRLNTPPLEQNCAPNSVQSTMVEQKSGRPAASKCALIPIQKAAPMDPDAGVANAVIVCNLPPWVPSGRPARSAASAPRDPRLLLREAPAAAPTAAAARRRSHLPDDWGCQSWQSSSNRWPWFWQAATPPCPAAASRPPQRLWRPPSRRGPATQSPAPPRGWRPPCPPRRRFRPNVVLEPSVCAQSGKGRCPSRSCLKSCPQPARLGS